VLSLSEFFASLLPFDFVPSQLLGLRHVSEILTRPRPEQSLLPRHNAEPHEYLYPVDDPNFRYDRRSGVPPIALMALPHLSADVDQLLDQILDGLPDTDRVAGAVFEQLFERLAADRDKDLWVERSGASLLFVDQLRQLFPSAKYIHIYRDGSACAASMSRHPSFRLMYFRQLARLAAPRRAGAKVVGGEPLWKGADELQDAIAGALGVDVTAELLLTSEVPVEWFGLMWSLMLSRGLRQLARQPSESVLHVAYEDLVGQPEDRLEEIARFIGIDADPVWIREQATAVERRPASLAGLNAHERMRLEKACVVGRDALASITGN
jgi:putative sulfotransferase